MFQARYCFCDVIWGNPAYGGKKEQALIRRRAFCVASDQSLNFLSHMSICGKRFYRFLYTLKII